MNKAVLLAFISSILFVFVILGILVFTSSNAMGGMVTVAWDANTEEDLQGYKIHYGLESRKTVTGKIEEWCVAKESWRQEECEKEWQNICKDRTNCHPWLYEYNTVVDVKNVTEYTIKDLVPGKTYYLAATAYSDPEVPNKESMFSIELTHKVGFEAPAMPIRLYMRLDPPYDLVITGSKLSDPIKKITEDK